MNQEMPAVAAQSPAPQSTLPGMDAVPIEPGHPRTGPTGSVAPVGDAFAETMRLASQASAGASHATPNVPEEVWDMSGWVGGSVTPTRDNGGPPSESHRPPHASGTDPGLLT